MKVPETIEAETRVKNMDDDIEQRVRKEKERRTRLAETKRLTQGITRKMEDERQKDNNRKAQEVAAEEARGLASVSSSKSEISKKKKAHRGRRGGRKHRKKSGNEALGSWEPLSADQAQDEDFGTISLRASTVRGIWKGTMTLWTAKPWRSFTGLSER
jgi:hypothetical protein